MGALQIWANEVPDSPRVETRVDHALRRCRSHQVRQFVDHGSQRDRDSKANGLSGATMVRLLRLPSSNFQTWIRRYSTRLAWNRAIVDTLSSYIYDRNGIFSPGSPFRLRNAVS